MKIDHIALYVIDLEGAKAFFENYFGGTSNEMYHNPKSGLKTYFITFPDGTRLEIMNRPEIEPSMFTNFRSGYIHLSMSVGSPEKVDSLTKRLAEDGYEILDGPRTTGDGFYESSIRGFENNIIEITV